ncbi:uncharacterized protein BDW43DRAFT_276204 [Aspergillus alliaceus]|uniref:uncharacterized protein n=1 Tax=Petromyces alliaceus TaxID=209559 RepID=UPI0012A6B5A2|nr:uncharacterized protein BDW43DRAFT_276204 [Aspergillus alliaceus]KAB8233404.1 hypothetical protein BDW43DRAFT_276204 [Aspergillus alliaceus]
MLWPQVHLISCLNPASLQTLGLSAQSPMNSSQIFLSYVNEIFITLVSNSIFFLPFFDQLRWHSYSGSILEVD